MDEESWRSGHNLSHHQYTHVAKRDIDINFGGVHFAKEYILFPALALFFLWKVMLGNWLAERMRDLYSPVTIYCGHVDEEVAWYPEGTRASGRGQ
ncbi:MAG: hypothetical protein ACJAZO_004867 [Myxococcota bacterium]